MPNFDFNIMDVKEMGERVFAAERLLKKRIRKVVNLPGFLLAFHRFCCALGPSIEFCLSL